MVITVKLLGALRGISGQSKLAIEFEGVVPLRKVIREITKELPKLKGVLINSELEDSRPSTLILVNGKEICVLNGLDTMLGDGDEVVLVPVVHGG
jgi:MoaD family protein